MCGSKIFIVAIFVITIYYGNCARILGIFNIPSKSHHILGSRLLKSLAERGHEVTMVSPFPFKEKIKNYRDIFLEEMLQYKEDNLQSIMKHNVTVLQKMTSSLGMFDEMSEIVLGHTEIEKLKKEKFDLVIQFALFTESYLGLAHHFKAPVILFCTIGSMPILNKITGNSAPPSYVPSMSFPVNAEMTFLQRVANVLSVWVYYGIFSHILEHRQQKLLSKYFPEAPSITELINNVSLVFVNSHYSIESPRPYVPNLIQIGGFHVEEPKELPLDIKKFLDEAAEGAIFFSLGSNVKISSLPKDAVQAIISVLGKLNLKILFKSEQDLPDLPKNIKTGKWLPQNDILGMAAYKKSIERKYLILSIFTAHPNVKLFISHGGLLSTIEAVYHGVPIIGIPIFGDQQMNVAYAALNGYAIRIDVDEITEKSFSNVINEILSNPKYRENIQLRSSLLKNQPIKPLDNAIYWVEHVLRYGGADHLKNAGTKLPLYQFLLLDVLAFLTAMCVLLIVISYFVFKKFVKCVKFISRKLKEKRD